MHAAETTKAICVHLRFKNINTCDMSIRKLRFSGSALSGNGACLHIQRNLLIALKYKYITRIYIRAKQLQYTREVFELFFPAGGEI
jgi:hypothetical protein